MGQATAGFLKGIPRLTTDGLALLAAASVFVLPVRALDQARAEKPIKTTLCELAKSRESFNGKFVKVRAVVVRGFEATVVQDESCKARILFVEAATSDSWAYGGPPLALTPEPSSRS